MNDEPRTPQVPGDAAFQVPEWLRRFGFASWMLIGIALAVLGLIYVITRLSTIVVPTLFAVLLGATFLPLVDRLERWHIRRWIGALLVMLMVVIAAVALMAVIVISVIQQGPTIIDNVEAGVSALADWLATLNVPNSMLKDAQDALAQGGERLLTGVAGFALRGAQSVASLVFGIFIALNILVYVLIEARRLAYWASTHTHPVQQPVAYAIIANAARFLRGYIWGSTLIGVFNGMVMGVGALVIGVPLAATIGIVGWATNYIPMFGALIGGLFAVLIALGGAGVKEALFMLVVILIANGPLQNVVSQFALGSALKLSPLAVLFSTTIGAVVAGALGGIFAAPFLKIVVDASTRIRASGLLGDLTATGAGGGGGPPGPAGGAGPAPGGPPGTPPGTPPAAPPGAVSSPGP
jgi:predicted PurR-regulated permease PerM